MSYAEKLEWGSSLSTFWNMDFETLKSLADAGIRNVEPSFYYDYYFNVLDFPKNAGRLAERAANAGVGLYSLHLPFSEFFDISIENYEALYNRQKQILGDRMGGFERFCLLSSVDSKWMEHLDAMDDLRGGVGLSSYAQRNPLNEYRINGSIMFDEMIKDIREETVKRIMFSRIETEQTRAEASKKRAAAAVAGATDAPKKPVVKAKSEKIGRNDPCPCGSGKKYKKCCGMNAQE